MVQLITQPPAATPVSVQSPPPVNPPAHDVRALGSLLESSASIRSEKASTTALAGFAVGLLDLDAIDQDLRDQGFGGLSEDQEAALLAAGTDAQKFKALQTQRSRTRSGMLKRAVRARQFIAENPLLVEEALKIYGNAVGRAPGDTIRELETDPLAKDIAEANPIAIYQQGILDDAQAMGLDPTRPIGDLERVVTNKREILNRAEIEGAKWAALDATLKQDEVRILDNFMISTWPKFTTELTGRLQNLVVPTTTQEKEALIDELKRDFSETKRQYDAYVGLYGQQNQAYIASWAMMQDLLDQKISSIDGSRPAGIDLAVRNRLQYIIDNIENTAKREFLNTPIVMANGQPVNGAQMQQVFNLVKDQDLSALIGMDVAGMPFKVQLQHLLAMTGVDINMAGAVLGNTSDEQAKVAFTNALGAARGAARGKPGFTTETAINLMNSYFNNFNNSAHVPRSVQEVVLETLADREVAGWLLENGYNLLDAVNGPNATYVKDSIRLVNKDLADHDVTMSVVESPGGFFSVAFKGDKRAVDTVRNLHKTRMEALIRSRILWIGGTPEEALELIKEESSTFYQAPKPEADETTINLTNG